MPIKNLGSYGDLFIEFDIIFAKKINKCTKKENTRT